MTPRFAITILDKDKVEVEGFGLTEETACSDLRSKVSYRLWKEGAKPKVVEGLPMGNAFLELMKQAGYAIIITDLDGKNTVF